MCLLGDRHIVSHLLLLIESLAIIIIISVSTLSGTWLLLLFLSQRQSDGKEHAQAHSLGLTTSIHTFPSFVCLPIYPSDRLAVSTRTLNRPFARSFPLSSVLVHWPINLMAALLCVCVRAHRVLIHTLPPLSFVCHFLLFVVSAIATDCCRNCAFTPTTFFHCCASTTIDLQDLLCSSNSSFGCKHV